MVWQLVTPAVMALQLCTHASSPHVGLYIAEHQGAMASANASIVC